LESERGSTTCNASPIQRQSKRREIITTLAETDRLRRRCHGSSTDCFPQVSMLPHEEKDLYLDLHAGGLIPEATGTHAGRKGPPSSMVVLLLTDDM